MAAPRLRLSPVARISMGLVALAVTLLLVLDTLFGLLPDDAEIQRQARQRSSESLAVQIVALIQAGERETLRRTLQEVLSRDRQMLSAAVRDLDGHILVQAGEHQRHWVPPDQGRSTVTQIQVPVLSGQRHWGDVELSFRRPPRDLGTWLRQPATLLVGAMALVGFLAFYFYLRRVLQHLDPTTAIPERVRSAFDTFTEGVMVLDVKGRIMMANDTCRRLCGVEADALHGRPLAELAWVRQALPGSAAELPWMRAMSRNAAIKGEALDIPQPDGSLARMILTCAPIHDGRQQTRGCLVTFNDVTELHKANIQLTAALAELEASRRHIEAQNEELRLLASRDPLTGCLNRRAFFEALGRLGADQGRSHLCCILADIDHFKLVNDRYGHAVGDQVLQAVARVLSRDLRAEDLLCRWGGEEFCVILPDLALEQGVEIAQRLRADIEAQAGSAIRSMPGIRVTASFGIAAWAPDIGEPAQLIDRADQALYEAKDAGRNRVMLWHAPSEVQPQGS